jgi:hypothetical protein
MSRIGMSLVALSLVAGVAPEVDATCAVAAQTAKLVVVDAKVPEGGGLLVTMVHDASPTPTSKYMDVTQPKWRFRAGKTEHVPQIDTLAPGLAIYRLPKDVTSAQLVDGKTVLGSITVTKDPIATLAAPKIKKLRQESRGSRKGSTIYMWADLAEKPPADAVALVVADDKVARSFGFAAVNDKNSVLVYAHEPCGMDAKGTVMSTNGDKLKLYWIDRAGRASPATKATLVEKGSPLDGIGEP